MITRCAQTYLCLSSCGSLIQWTTKPLGGSLSYFTIMSTNWAFVRDADDWVAMCRKKFLKELNFAFRASELGKSKLAAGESAPRTSVEPNSHGDLSTNGPDSR
jgi:hypothetical protein